MTITKSARERIEREAQNLPAQIAVRGLRACYIEGRVAEHERMSKLLGEARTVVNGIFDSPIVAGMLAAIRDRARRDRVKNPIDAADEFLAKLKEGMK